LSKRYWPIVPYSPSGVSTPARPRLTYVVNCGWLFTSRYVSVAADRETTIVPSPAGASSGRDTTTSFGAGMRFKSDECTTAPAYRPPSMRYHVALPLTASPVTSDSTFTRSPGTRLPTTGALVLGPTRTLACERTPAHQPPGASEASGSFQAAAHSDVAARSV